MRQSKIADAARAVHQLLPIVIAQRDLILECHSHLRQTPRGIEPIPGTLEPEVMAEVRAMNKAIKAGRAVLAGRRSIK